MKITPGNPGNRGNILEIYFSDFKTPCVMSQMICLWCDQAVS